MTVDGNEVITLSQLKQILNEGGGLQARVTLTGDIGTVITYSNGNKTYIKTLKSNSEYFYLNDYGVWNFSFTVLDTHFSFLSINVTAAQDYGTYSAVANIENIDTLSWDTIAALPFTTITNLIGQTKSVDISGYGVHDFQLIGVGQDTLSSGSKSTPVLTFMSVDCVTKHNMNKTNTSSGGWGSTEMRAFCNNDLYNALPSELRAQIKSVDKRYEDYDNMGNIQTISDKIWLASEKEIAGTTVFGDDEGNFYTYWQNHNNKDARIKKYNDKANNYWLRSIGSVSSYFCYINTGGSASAFFSTTSYGCVPCFCI